jgi:hypothetical protein
MNAFMEVLFSKKVIAICLAGIFLFPGTTVFSQHPDDSIPVPSKSVWVIQPQVHIGKLVKIYPQFPQSQFTDLNEIRISLQTTGNKEWHQLYHYPKVGFTFIYGYLGNTTILGQNFAIVPDLSFQTHTDKRWMLETRLGFGFTYFTKHYDAIDNPTNNVIGSSFTNITFITEDLNYKLSKKLNINIGIAAFHCSDGHYQLPNLGANIPSVNLGFSYCPAGLPKFYQHDTVAKPVKKILLNVFAGYGRHEFGSATKPTGGPKYPVFQGGIYISKRYRKINNFQAGLSYTYFTDYYDFIVNEEYFNSQQHLKASVITAFIGNEFIIGKFGLLAQSGVNLYTPFLAKYSASRNDHDFLSLYITNKIGIQYYIFDPTLHPRKNVYFGLYIKAHFGTADFAEAGLGYTF